MVSFPNGLESGPDTIVLKFFKDHFSKLNGNTVFIFFKLLTMLLNSIVEVKTPDLLRPFFVGAKLVDLNKDRRLHPIAINSF